MSKTGLIRKGSLRDLILKTLEKLGGHGSIQQVTSEISPLISATRAASIGRRIAESEARRNRSRRKKDLKMLITRGKKHLATQALVSLTNDGHTERVRQGVYRIAQSKPNKVVVMSDHIREFLRLHGESSSDQIIENVKDLVTTDQALHSFSFYKKQEEKRGKITKIQDEIAFGTRKIIKDLLSSLITRGSIKRTRNATRKIPALYKLA